MCKNVCEYRKIVLKRYQRWCRNLITRITITAKTFRKGELLLWYFAILIFLIKYIMAQSVSVSLKCGVSGILKPCLVTFLYVLLLKTVSM